MKKSCLKYFFIIFLLALILPTTPALFAQEETSPPAVVHVVKVIGIVNPVMSEYISHNIKEAETAGANAVILELDTPGGLDVSMRDIVKAILASRVPVIVYVAPPGSRAASAGVFITYSAHIAVMAPGTNIGSAHPVAMGGKKMDETMTAKVENDASAYIMSLAAKRGRNMPWAEKAVRESLNITASEALRLHVIEFMADDVSSLLIAVDGRVVDTVAGKVTLKTANAKIVTVEMGLRHRILDAIINPNVAYILMMIGMAGLYFELSNPGAILPGVIGAISIILAFYSFQTLPVNYAGLILIGLGCAFFVIELSVTSFGLLTIAGLVSLTLGSLMLFDSPLPFMRVSLSILAPMIALVGIFFTTVVYYTVKIYKQPPVSGTQALIGVEGTALSDMTPEGKVFVEGEYWDAKSTDLIKKDDKIKVVDITGLKLTVKKA